MSQHDRKRWPSLVAANVDRETHRELHELAREQNMSVATVVRRAVREHLERASGEPREAA